MTERHISESTEVLCELCGAPMPAGERMFKYHGYSGPCPMPPIAQLSVRDREMAHQFLAPYPDLRGAVIAERLCALIAAARAAERERCAKIAKRTAQAMAEEDEICCAGVADNIATRIRSNQ